jgi:UDP-N-acetylmuramoyl-L-alanyl-D-glutamate--2,6-diaminopimelate ligase
VHNISCDSRKVHPGDLFLAIRGRRNHGLDFYDNVRAAGASAIVWEPGYAHNKDENDALCPLLPVANLSSKLGAIADRFYGYPSQNLKLIGITGTDGKTSCAHFISQCLHQADKPCGLLGTLGYGFYNDLQPSGLTTTDAVTLRRWLTQVRARNGRFSVMEVSSHALSQERPKGLQFAVAVLTNLTRDHLDYHGDLAGYAAAKKRLFCDYQPRHLIFNHDDAYGLDWAEQFENPIVYGWQRSSQPPGKYRYVWAQNVALSHAGLSLRICSSWGSGELQSRLLGQFNVSNLLATLATLLALEIPFAEALQKITQVKTAPGRMQRLGGYDGKPLAIVDYAHTPHALDQVLSALRAHTRGRLWCVFGCGGDRDPGKRPLMGAHAECWADELIVTNDNPRSEDPKLIVRQILAGMKEPKRARVQLDRELAIMQALSEARSDDVVLIAGKGHENYQLLGDTSVPFSDQKIVKHWLGETDNAAATE